MHIFNIFKKFFFFFIDFYKTNIVWGYLEAKITAGELHTQRKAAKKQIIFSQ